MLQEHPGRVHGWESVFWGGLWFLGNLKDSKMWLSRNTKIPRPSKLVNKYRHFPLFDLVWFTYVSRFLRLSDFQSSSRFHHRKILWKRSEKPNVLDSNNWFAKNTKIPFFKNMVGWVGLIYVLRFSKIFGFPETLQDSTIVKLFENARRSQLFWTHQILNKKTKRKQHPHFLCPVGSIFLKFWISRMLRYEK